MSLMGANSISRYLVTQQRAFRRFKQHKNEDLQGFAANQQSIQNKLNCVYKLVEYS
jgi:hypothetical protein